MIIFSPFFGLILLRSFRNKECREKGQEKDVNSSGQTSTNAPSTDPVLFKIGEDNAAYQELRVPWVCVLKTHKYVFFINNELKCLECFIKMNQQM